MARHFRFRLGHEIVTPPDKIGVQLSAIDGDLPWRWSIRERTLLVEFQHEFAAISWAPLGGGFRTAKLIANHQIGLSNLDATERPSQYLASQLKVLGFDADSSVAMMTGADVSAAAYELLTHRELQVAAWTTAGCSNALSVGDSATVERTSPGTINIIVAVNQPLSRNALVEAVQIATEARVVAVQKAGVRSVVSGNPATGTGTDCVAVAAPAIDPIHHYCGKHTRVGELIGKAVLASCLSAIHA